MPAEGERKASMMKAEALNERPEKSGPALSNYELALMRMVLEDLDPAEMAETLASTRSAVQQQLSLIRFKLGVNNDLQAAELAKARGWI